MVGTWNGIKGMPAYMLINDMKIADGIRVASNRNNKTMR